MISSTQAFLSLLFAFAILAPGCGGSKAGNTTDPTQPDAAMAGATGHGGTAAGGTGGRTTGGSTAGTGGTRAGGSGGGGKGGTGKGGATGSGGAGGAGSTFVSDGTCGEPGQICCPGNACVDGGCCIEDQCVRPGALCLPVPGTCNAGACQDGTCGTVGKPCCKDRYDATDVSICTGPLTYCSSGKCQACGSSYARCCSAPSMASAQELPPTCMTAGLVCDGTTTKSSCTPCGEPGKLCCPGNKCNGGACCFDGLCTAEAATCKLTSSTSAGGVCSAGRCAECGGDGQRCCGKSCAAGFACRAGVCMPCGQGGQACCDSNKPVERCAAGTVCDSATPTQGTCVACGVPGAPCCPGEKCSSGCCLRSGWDKSLCVAEGATCSAGSGSSESYGQCKSGRCGCGDANQPCCTNYSFAIPGRCSSLELLCDEKAPGGPTCVPCGHVGTPCCVENTCLTPGAGCIGPEASGGTCQLCGHAGQTCCQKSQDCLEADMACGEPGICTACGAPDAVCCANGNCNDPGYACQGRCKPCGQPGGPCCTGNVCDQGCCVSTVDWADSMRAVCVAEGKVCDSSDRVVGSPLCDATSGVCSSSTTTCGGLDQECCVSRVDSTTSMRICAAKGTRCTPETAGTTTRYLCRACGDKGQPCCVDYIEARSDKLPRPGCRSPYTCTSGGLYTCQ